MTRPLLPGKLDALDETQKSRERELYRRRLVHYHYIKNTEEHNELHYAALTGLPCPVTFDAEDVHDMMKLDAEQREADETLEMCQNMIGFGPEGWVTAEHYKEAMERSKQLKENSLAMASSSEEQAQIAVHWPLEDMDEKDYM